MKAILIIIFLAMNIILINSKSKDLFEIFEEKNSSNSQSKKKNKGEKMVVKSNMAIKNIKASSINNEKTTIKRKVVYKNGVRVTEVVQKEIATNGKITKVTVDNRATDISKFNRSQKNVEIIKKDGYVNVDNKIKPDVNRLKQKLANNASDDILKEIADLNAIRDEKNQKLQNGKVKKNSADEKLKDEIRKKKEDAIKRRGIEKIKNQKEKKLAELIMEKDKFAKEAAELEKKKTKIDRYYGKKK